MAELKVQRLAGCLGVELPADAVDRLGICEGDVLSLDEVSPGEFRLTRHDRVMAKAENVIQRYRGTLRTLAG